MRHAPLGGSRDALSCPMPFAVAPDPTADSRPLRSGGRLNIIIFFFLLWTLSAACGPRLVTRCLNNE